MSYLDMKEPDTIQALIQGHIGEWTDHQESNHSHLLKLML